MGGLFAFVPRLAAGANLLPRERLLSFLIFRTRLRFRKLNINRNLVHQPQTSLGQERKRGAGQFTIFFRQDFFIGFFAFAQSPRSSARRARPIFATPTARAWFPY